MSEDGKYKQAHASVVEAMEQAYASLQIELAQSPAKCIACGKCCDFESFGHRLYITSPELLYFRIKLVENNIPVLPMITGICPYRKDGKCTVYSWRFAGCRIFNCTGDTDLQSRLSENAIAFFRALCIKYDLDYRYMDLKSGLENIE